jgi:CelD/BcsL family acetyltransferase involved in cellulose biosynthesis
MRTELCRPSELGSVEIESWRALQSTDRRFENPFLSPTFAQAVGDVDPRARVAIVTDGPSTCAFLPLTLTNSVVATGLARGLAGCHGVLSAPGFDYPFEEILADCGLAVFEFSNFVGPDPPTELAGAKTVPTHIADISGGFEAYLAERRSSQPKYFSWLRRKRSRIEADVGPVVFTAGRPDQEGFDRLIEWKSNQYRRSGWPDPFARQWVRDLVQEIAHIKEPDLTGRLSVCRAAGRILAVDFRVHSQSVYAGWFVTYNPEFARFSPGSVRWLYVIEDAAAMGLREVDIGPGDERYKEKLAADGFPLLEGRVARNCLRAVARRARTAPRLVATDFILAHPRVRKGVRGSLRTVGRLRCPPPPVEVWA